MKCNNFELDTSEVREKSDNCVANHSHQYVINKNTQPEKTVEYIKNKIENLHDVEDLESPLHLLLKQRMPCWLRISI